MLPPGRSTARFALAGTVVGSVGVATAYATAFLPAPLAGVGPWVMAVALPLLMLAMMTLGAARAGRGLRALTVPFALVFVLVAGGFLAALWLPPDTANGPYWLGLPRRAAVIVYGVGLLPLFVLPVAYALTFDRLTLSSEDIARVVAARRGAPREERAE